jgi:hypothetical protein
LVWREEEITMVKKIDDYRWRGWIWPKCSYDGEQFQNEVWSTF